MIDTTTATKQRTMEGTGQANSGYCSYYEDIIRTVCSILISFTVTYRDNQAQNKCIEIHSQYVEGLGTVLGCFLLMSPKYIVTVHNWWLINRRVNDN